MIERTYGVYVDQNNFGRSVNISLFTPGEKLGNYLVLRVDSMSVVEVDDSAEAEPFLTLPIETAQRLFDGLWAIGLRPRMDAQPTGAHLDALNAHINDLRYMANRLVEYVTKPEECGL